VAGKSREEASRGVELEIFLSAATQSWHYASVDGVTNGPGRGGEIVFLRRQRVIGKRSQHHQQQQQQHEL